MRFPLNTYNTVPEVDSVRILDAEIRGVVTTRDVVWIDYSLTPALRSRLERRLL